MIYFKSLLSDLAGLPSISPRIAAGKSSPGGSNERSECHLMCCSNSNERNERHFMCCSNSNERSECHLVCCSNSNERNERHFMCCSFPGELNYRGRQSALIKVGRAWDASLLASRGPATFCYLSNLCASVSLWQKPNFAKRTHFSLQNSINQKDMHTINLIKVIQTHSRLAPFHAMHKRIPPIYFKTF